MKFLESKCYLVDSVMRGGAVLLCLCLVRIQTRIVFWTKWIFVITQKIIFVSRVVWGKPYTQCGSSNYCMLIPGNQILIARNDVRLLFCANQLRIVNLNHTVEHRCRGFLKFDFKVWIEIELELSKSFDIFAYDYQIKFWFRVKCKQFIIMRHYFFRRQSLFGFIWWYSINDNKINHMRTIAQFVFQRFILINWSSKNIANFFGPGVYLVLDYFTTLCTSIKL